MNILETDRLILRQVQVGDCVDLASVLADPEVMKYSLKGIHSKEQIAEYVTNTRNTYKEKGFGQWVVATKAGEFVGICGLNQHLIEGEELTHIMYRLALKQQGKGYATEVAKAVVDYANFGLSISRVYALIEPENVASLAVLNRVGFNRYKEATFGGVKVTVYQS